MYQQPPQAQPPIQTLFLQPQNRNYLIAGIGAVVAIIAIFLPFVTVSYTFLRTTESFFVSGASSGTYWFLWLLSAAVIAAVVLIVIRPQSPFGIATMPPFKQVQIAVYGIAGIGALNTLVTLISMANISSAFGSYTSGYTISFGIGLILFLLGCIAIAVGGVLQVLQIRKNPYAAVNTPQSPYGVPQQPPVNPYVTPSNPSNPSFPNTTYPPYGQQPQPSQTPYPPTQYQQPPQTPSGQYPPQMGQYPPQQSPQYPPQQPPQYPPSN